MPADLIFVRHHKSQRRPVLVRREWPQEQGWGDQGNVDDPETITWVGRSLLWTSWVCPIAGRGFPVHLCPFHISSLPGTGREDFWIKHGCLCRERFHCRDGVQPQPVLVPGWEGRRGIATWQEGNGEKKSRWREQPTPCCSCRVSRSTFQPLFYPTPELKYPYYKTFSKCSPEFNAVLNVLQKSLHTQIGKNSLPNEHSPNKLGHTLLCQEHFGWK